MRQLSYFSVDIKDINSIEEGLRNIKKIFDNLFMDIDKRINIGMHLDAVEQFV